MNLRELRTSKKLTQAKAARFCGVTPNTWARWERGEMRPSSPALRLIQMMASRKFRSERENGARSKATKKREQGRSMKRGSYHDHRAKAPNAKA